MQDRIFKVYPTGKSTRYSLEETAKEEENLQESVLQEKEKGAGPIRRDRMARL
jgi:hypothetical protein